MKSGAGFGPQPPIYVSVPYIVLGTVPPLLVQGIALIYSRKCTAKPPDKRKIAHDNTYHHSPVS
jgi:hypothetical protein